MTTTNLQLFSPAQLTTSAATYYTVGSNLRSIIKKLSFCNTSAGAVTVTLYLIKSGGSAGDTNTLTSAHTLAAGETWSCPDVEGHVLHAADFIQAKASAATSVTVHGSGVEITTN